MGWMPSVCTALRRGLPAIANPIPVDEPAGYAGNVVTVRGGALALKRTGNIYATRLEAMRASKRLLKGGER